MRALTFAFFVAFFAAEPAIAQTELSIYGGTLSVPSSQATGDDPGGIGPIDFLVNWESGPSAVSDYGIRLTWWQNNNWGWGLDFTHGEFGADGPTLSANGLSTLGFSEGLNVLTINGYRKWDDLNGPLAPYVGAGVGVSLPVFEYQSGGPLTGDLQFAGPAVSIVAGASIPVNGRMSLFGEYRSILSANSLDLASSGRFDSNILANSINFGASFGF